MNCPVLADIDLERARFAALPAKVKVPRLAWATIPRSRPAD